MDSGCIIKYLESKNEIDRLFAVSTYVQFNRLFLTKKNFSNDERRILLLFWSPKYKKKKEQATNVYDSNR